MPVALTVEDELLVQYMLEDALMEAGFDVISTSSADEAMLMLERRDDISLLFTDINMPGSMDGLELAHIVRDRWPPIRIVITTGREPPKRIPSQAKFIMKPYSVDDVAKVATMWPS